MFYRDLLGLLHAELRPEVYLEIGVDEGDTLLRSTSRTIGIDPAPKLRHEVLSGKPWLKLYCQMSDDFFAQHTAEATLEGFSLDLAFIDGLHEFAQVVRDLGHVERWGHPDTIIVIHDVLPENVRQASHAFRAGGWTGDVWRVVSFLREHRPDLDCRLVEVRNSGALIVTRLDPGFPDMGQLAADVDQDFPGDGADYDRLVQAWIETARPEAAEDVLRALVQERSRNREASAELDAPDAPLLAESLPERDDLAIRVLASRLDRGMRILPETSWRPVLQRSIDAYYEGAFDEGIAACLTLLNEPALPEHIRDLTYRNQVFYARSLADLCPGARWQALGLLQGDAGTLRDPSPLVAEDGLIVLLRDDAGQAVSTPFALALDELELPEADVLTVPAGAGAGHTITEARPFRWQDDVYVAAILHDSATRAVVMQYRDGELVEVAGLGPRAGHFQQGWSPAVTPDGPRFVAWWEPTEVFQLNAAATALERVGLRLAPHLAERFQGGSPGVAVPGGYLFLVNETVTPDDGADVTLSRFVRTDDAFQITAVSPQVYLQDRGQEVATGLARQGERLIAGFASTGQGALLAAMDLEPILASLVMIPVPGRSIDPTTDTSSVATSSA